MPRVVEMERYGPPDVLRLVERPERAPGPGEVAIRVAVAAVNRADCFIRSGEWKQAGGWPYVPGLEACGTVLRVGPDVVDFAPADRVITMMQRMAGIHGERPGGYQEELVAPAATLARVPDALDLETAGALGLAAVTAHLAIAELAVEPGMRVLVTGGSGGVGTMAVQLLSAAGTTVVATGTRPDKFRTLERLGARPVNARARDWREQVGSVERVLDTVGAASFAGAVDALVPGGRLVFAGGTSGGELAFSGWALMRPITLSGWSSEALTRATLQRAIDDIAALFAAGKLGVASLFPLPLRAAAVAHAGIESGRFTGRVVLVPGLTAR